VKPSLGPTRLALGATSLGIVPWVLGHGVVRVAAGVAIGFVGSLASERFIQGLLFGVEPRDPGTLLKDRSRTRSAARSQRFARAKASLSPSKESQPGRRAWLS
jgi:hypothetical protein